MIYQYDIARDDEHHPTLIKVKQFNADRKITSTTESLVGFVKNYLHLDKYDNEHMYLIALDLQDNALGVFLLAIGDYKGVEVFKRNIAECLILSGARRFIMFHNHPSGKLSLSKDDLELQNEMFDLGNLFDIAFIANCVITEDGYTHSGLKKPVYFRNMNI